jgi:nucleotide-binding universal stress UspA family protein
MNDVKGLNTMLVCLDLTEIDQHLIQYASFIGEALHVNRVVFLHAIQAYDLPDKKSKKYPDLETSLSQTIQKEISNAVSERFQSGIQTEVVTKIENEDAADMIIEYSRNHEIDLTLIGQKFGEDRSGRYGQKIATQVKSDLMFVPESPELAVDKILCAIDFSEKSQRAFQRALDIRQVTGAELTCHYIYDTSESYFPATTLRSSSNQEKAARKKFGKFLEKFDMSPEDLHCNFEINDKITGHAARINAEAESQKSQLVVIGTKGQAGTVTSLLGNVTENIRRMDMEMPVMIMKNHRK